MHEEGPRPGARIRILLPCRAMTCVPLWESLRCGDCQPGQQAMVIHHLHHTSRVQDTATHLTEGPLERLRGCAMHEPPCSPQSCPPLQLFLLTALLLSSWKGLIQPPCPRCCQARLCLPSEEPQLCPLGCPTPQRPHSAVAPRFCSCCPWLLSSCHHEGSDVPIVSWLCLREGLEWGRVQPNLLPAHTAGERSKILLAASEQCLGHLWYTQQFGKTLLPPCCSHKN